MKFQRIVEAVYYQPWAITEAGWRDIHRIVKPHLMGAELPAHVTAFISRFTKPGEDADKLMLSEAPEMPEMDFFGDPIEQMCVNANGSAIIPVNGPLINHASLMDRMCGACSYQQIQEDLDALAHTEGITTAFLKINSPGGMCNGMIETARAIIRLRSTGIKVRAVSETYIASAAYLLASACDSIGITETTTIGSIGTFAAVLDSSKAYEMAGLKVEVVKSGEYKGEVDGLPMTDKQRADLQRSITFLGEEFRSLVKQNRMIEDKLMQGQVFTGTESLENGFADLLIQDCAAAYGMDDEETDED